MMITQRTNSSFRDEITKEILKRYTIPKIGKLLTIDLYSEFHKKMITQLGKTLPKQMALAATNAVKQYYTEQKAFAMLGTYTDKELKQQIFKLTVNNYLKNAKNSPVKLKISTNIFPLINISNLNSSHVNKIIQTEMTVIGPSQPMVYPSSVETPNGIIQYELYDPKNDGPIVKTFYNDVQFVLCEEILTNQKDLRKITVKVYGDFVGKFNIGDKVRILGYYEPLGEDEGAKEQRLYIDAINVTKIEEKQSLKLSTTDLEMFTALSKTPETYLKALTDSFAPHIYGNELPKLGILLASMISSKIHDSRSNLLLLLEGNPGVGKSEMLKAALKLHDNVAYVDAPNVSARGLLYGQEEFNKSKILRAGVLVRYNLVLLDELDKMGKGQREELNTATEQQIASYHKTPFDMDTPINVGIIASANPAGGRWKEDRAITENLGNLESTVLDRYLIIHVEKPLNNEAKYDLMLDSIDDRKHNTPFTYDQLRALISHAQTLNPVFTEESKKLIKQFLVKFASIEQSGRADLYIETRKEYDLIRIIKKISQLLLRETIDDECVEIGIDFYRKCMASVGISTEVPTVQSNLVPDGPLEVFWKIFNELVSESEDDTVSESDIKKNMEEADLWKNPTKIDDFIERLMNVKIYEPRAGRFKKI